MNFNLLKKTVAMPLVLSIMAISICTPVYGQTKKQDAELRAIVLYNIAVLQCNEAYEGCKAEAWVSGDPDVINNKLEMCRKTFQECIKKLGPAPKLSESPN